MTTRHIYNQRIRPFAFAVWITMGGYLASLIVLRLVVGPNTLFFAVLFGGLLPLVIAALAYQFHAKCPKCKGRIANLFGGPQVSGWPYPGKLPKAIIACPFCGLIFDEELKSETKEMDNRVAGD